MTQSTATQTATSPTPAAPVMFNTTQAANKIGVNKKGLIEALVGDSLVTRTKNRHYKANPALIRAGMATSGDLKWTKQGISFLKKAYQPLLG